MQRQNHALIEVELGEIEVIGIAAVGENGAFICRDESHREKTENLRLPVTLDQAVTDTDFEWASGIFSGFDGDDLPEFAIYPGVFGGRFEGEFAARSIPAVEDLLLIILLGIDDGGVLGGGNDGTAVNDQTGKNSGGRIDLCSTSVAGNLSDLSRGGSFGRVKGRTRGDRFVDGDFVNVEFITVFKVAGTDVNQY